MHNLFNETDRQRIAEAVAAAEGRTSGEIVPYVVEASDRYEVAAWRGAALTGLVASAAVLTVLQIYEGWGLGWLHMAWGTLLVVLGAGLLGGLLAAYVPPLKRLLAGQTTMARHVHQRALQAFVEEEVFSTRDRTGILLFISLLEHRIEVVGDAGINARVEADEWVEVVAEVREGIQKGRPAEGLITAIDHCGRLLERQGVALRTDDTNELPDGLRFGGTP